MIFSTRNTILNEEEFIDLSKLIQNDELNIVFGNIDTITEYNIPIDNGITIMVRNKQLDGASGNAITHDLTIKLIAGDKFYHEGMKGVPLEIEPEIRLYKKADNPDNRREMRQYNKIVKKFVKENKDLLKEYWNIDPTIDGSMEKIKRDRKNN